MRPAPKRNQGFSLVEMLVVLSIIVILLGILASLLMKSSVTAAYTATCASNLHQNRMAMGSNRFAEKYSTTVPNPHNWVDWIIASTGQRGGVACCPEDPTC
ncbi:MAG: type II secretion system protein, partial [Phycisphaeraceae bacterium]|nr:type II secretion system protein [Phycisphaeraceae bacterium]